MALVERAFIPLAFVAWGVAGTLLAVGLFFSYRYGTQIPANFGPRRLFGYMILLPALVVPGLLEAVSRPLVRGNRVALAVLPLAAAVFAIGAAAARMPERSLPAAETGQSVMARVAGVVPCGARMLPNARTAGSWEAVTGRRSIIEGMAPYLRPEVMAHVLPLLVDSREFFRDPRGESRLPRAGTGRLRRVRPTGPLDRDRGRSHPDRRRPSRPPGRCPELRPVLEDDQVSVFAVGGEASAEAGPQPPRCPL